MSATSRTFATPVSTICAYIGNDLRDARLGARRVWRKGSLYDTLFACVKPKLYHDDTVQSSSEHPPPCPIRLSRVGSAERLQQIRPAHARLSSLSGAMRSRHMGEAYGW